MKAVLTRCAVTDGKASAEVPMRPAQVQAERLTPLDQASQVGITTQPVVDQLTAQRLLPTDPLPASSLVAPNERSHRAVDDPHHCLSSGAHLHREGSPRHSRHAADKYRSTARAAGTPCSAARRPRTATPASSRSRGRRPDTAASASRGR